MSASGRATPRQSGVGVFPWIASLFALKPERLHPVLALVVAVTAIAPLLALGALGHPHPGGGG